MDCQTDSSAPKAGKASDPSMSNLPVIQRVEKIIDAAYDWSPLKSGREVYVPLALLHDVVVELDRGQRAYEGLIEALPYVEMCEADNAYKPGHMRAVITRLAACVNRYAEQHPR